MDESSISPVQGKREILLITGNTHGSLSLGRHSAFTSETIIPQSDTVPGALNGPPWAATVYTRPVLTEILTVTRELESNPS